MEIDDELFDRWAAIRDRIATARTQHQTGSEAYRQDRLWNAEIMRVVDDALPYDLSQPRLRQAEQRLDLRKNSPPEPHPETGPGAPVPPPPIDRTEAVIEALSQSGSPLRVIGSLVNDPRVDWADNTSNPTKAFLCACLSELVYLRMSRYEVPGKDRYRVIPSPSLRQLLETGTRIDLERIVQRSEIPSATGETASIVFGTFTFPTFVVIAVRGTMPRLNDWLLDLDDRRVRKHGRRYHAGFYLDVEDALPEIVRTVPRDHRPIYFTGHSMGAAIAGILPQIWPQPSPHPLMTPYTFASPRFGDAAVARFPVYAYVRAFDPVPHLPPRQAGFRSSGWPPEILPATDHWIPGWKLMWKWRSLLPAHSMEAYRELVGQAANGPHFHSDIYRHALASALQDPGSI